MKKILSIILVVILVFGMVGCSTAEKKSDIEKVEEMIRDGETDAAVSELEELLDKDELNLEAWDLMADALIKGGEFEKADEWLEQYLELVDDNIDNDDFDKLKAIDSIGDFARDIRREGEFVSSWYDNLIPKAINTDDLSYEYEMGTLLEFDIQKGTEMYFSFEGNPKSDGTKYVDGIILDGEGYTNIDFVVVNDYGEYSAVTSAWFDVYNPDYGSDTGDDVTDVVMGEIDLVLPEVDTAPGTYTEFMEVRITNYDINNENLSITYTTDGSDPRDYNNSSRYYYDSIPLAAGEYKLAIAAYDYMTDAYSEVSYFDYYIDQPGMVKVGLYMLPDASVAVYREMFDEAAWYDLYVAPIVYDDLDFANMDAEDLPDLLITYGTYAEDLEAYGIVANIENHFNIADYDIIGQADKIGEFNGTKYMMPITIRPEFMVYGDYEGAGLIDWDFLQGESDWYEAKFGFAADSPEFFLGVYYGLGGEILDATASNLNKAKLVEALTMIQSLTDAGIQDRLITSTEVFDGMYNYTYEYFVMGDTIERDPEYYFSQVGQMPLSNGNYAKYYNVATGLFVSNLSALDPTFQSKIEEVYNYIMVDSWSVNNIASAEGALPATRYAAEDYEFYLNVTLDEYIEMIENGESSIRSYSLYTVYEAMGQPLTDFVNGATPEEVAESIMLNLSNSSN